MSASFSWELFNKIPVVGIMRNMPRQQTELLVEHYYQSGLSTLEVTMNSEGAEDMISGLVKAYGAAPCKLNIGAGTVCNMHDLDKALRAGATFIVAPIIDEQVIKTCVEEQVPIFPGAYTPSEIYKAWSLGASMVKVFPATTLGPSYMKEVLAPLNNVELLPTGGVTLENFTDYLKAGARGVGMGSSLFPKDLVENSRWSALKLHFSQLIDQYQQYLKN